MYLPDAIRLVTVATAVLAIAVFPATVYIQGRKRSAYLAVAGCECLLFSCAHSILDFVGRPIVWYRTPLTLLGSTLILIFSASVILQRGAKK